MKKYIIRAFLLLLAVAMFLSSCVNDPEKPGTEVTSDDTESGTTAEAKVEDILIASESFADYVIIRPDVDDTGKYVASITALKNAVKENCNADLKIKTDWLNTKGGEVPAELEILVGITNRDESKRVLETLEGNNDFAIAMVNKKLVIIGATPKATLYATEYFISNYVTGNSIKLAADLNCGGTMPNILTLKKVDGMIESECSIKEIYPGVSAAYYSLASTSKYGLQKFTVIDFDPKQADLYFRVVMGGNTSNQLKTVGTTVKNFNENNTEGLKAIAAINGDLWMVTYAHARVLGKGTTYGGYSDAVVTKSLTVPRGFDMYNGEIISSAHIPQETPYEGAFYSFGVTEDGVPYLGNPQVKITATDLTTNTNVNVDGLNRLPANDAIIMYSDVYSTSNYSLDDACEVIIDCDYDYTVCHGAKITGKITAITNPGDAKQNMKPNRVILTARGTKKVLLGKFAVGDTVELNISVTDQLRNTEAWQNMKNAVGGHIPVIIDGKSQNSKNTTKYPMSVLGITDEGHVVMIVNDGRQSEWSVGIMISDLDDVCKELDVVTAFLLDGGGSSEMVLLNGDGSYSTVNKPSDGSSRTVVNSVILAYGPKKTK